MKYTELQVVSNFSFLRGASHSDELFWQAKALGYDAMAVTDRNTFACSVRAHQAAKAQEIRPIVGCRLDLRDGPSLLAYPTNRAAFGRLSRLLTAGNLRAPKGQCWLDRADVYAHAEGLKLIAVPPLALNDDFAMVLQEYRQQFGKSLYVAATHYYQGDDARRLALLARLSTELSIPLVATNDVHYHVAERRPLQDALTCVREKCTIYTAGYLLAANAERHLKHPDEMIRLFRDYPDAIRCTQEIADACRFSLDELRYEYPHEITSDGRTPQQKLEKLSWEGAAWRFPNGLPSKVKENIEKELAFIGEVNYAPYFLTVYDIVRYARSRDILCQGRGSAANSVICYCLGITSVDPMEIDLLFERFLSSARNEPPDIDVDFEHERREEVIQYIYKKYGRARAGIVATVSQYRQKGAIRDIGKAMGLSTDIIERLSGSIWHMTTEWFDAERLQENGLDPTDKHLRQTIALAGQLLGFPRHLGQHVGGFVISRGPLAELCPIMNAAMDERTTIEWDKDDINALGFMKVDVLALGMLTCVHKAFDLLAAHYGKQFTLATIPQKDGATFDMICKADTVGVFQIESRAQMSMLPRLKPRCFYDLVIEVAIVRPGPIQGDMVHPYLRRRDGLEEPLIPKGLEHILNKTLGVPLFQEQAMNVAIVAAGFSPADADRLRRAMATFKAVGTVEDFRSKLLTGMIANGYGKEFAERCCRQLEGFGSYGFPESHAASFALLVYVSSYIKCHYPAVFACALLNSQPMGFYLPAQIIRDAREHGVAMREADINFSDWHYRMEWAGADYGLRVGFRQVKGMSEAEADKISGARGAGYTDIATLWQRSGISYGTLEHLAQADAFRSLDLDRREALWQVRALGERPSQLFGSEQNEAIVEPAVRLPLMTQGEHVMHDYSRLSLSLKNHPVHFVRSRLDALRAVKATDLSRTANRTAVKLAGLVLVRQRPGTASGIVFITLEDESGVANLVVFRDIFERFRKNILSARLLMVEGIVQREGDVIHIVAKCLYNLSPWLSALNVPEDGNLLSDAGDLRHVIPEARNFH